MIKMDWYTLRVISGKEKKIKESILFEINTANLDQYVENILVPTENVLEMRDGKKKIKEKVFFPGYLLINIDMNKETKYVVENVNGVISFVGSNGKPESLKPDEVKRFLGDHDGGDGPSTNPKLARLLPTAFPKARSVFPWRAPVTFMTSSGALVPKATTVSPMIRLGTLKA